MDRPARDHSTTSNKSISQRYREKSTPAKRKISESFRKKIAVETKNFEKEIQVSDSLEGLTIKKNSNVNSIEPPDTVSHVLPLASDIKSITPAIPGKNNASAKVAVPSERPSVFWTSLAQLAQTALETIVRLLKISYWVAVSFFFAFLFSEAFRDIMRVDIVTWISLEETEYAEMWI